MLGGWIKPLTLIHSLGKSILLHNREFKASDRESSEHVDSMSLLKQFCSHLTKIPTPPEKFCQEKSKGFNANSILTESKGSRESVVQQLFDYSFFLLACLRQLLVYLTSLNFVYLTGRESFFDKTVWVFPLSSCMFTSTACLRYIAELCLPFWQRRSYSQRRLM